MLAGQISERTGSMIKNQNLGAGTDTRFWNAPGLDGALNGALYAYKRLRQYINQAPYRPVPLRLRFLVAGGSRPDDPRILGLDQFKVFACFR